jgi:hypothetical protein
MMAVAATNILAQATARRDPFSLMMVAVVFAVGGGAYWYRIRPLMDTVDDCGDSLLLHRRGEEEQVPFHEIINASLSNRESRVTLRLARPGQFGDQVVFIAKRPFTMNPFARIPVFEDLVTRIDQARALRKS